jgi:hypothetical protein
MMAVQTLTLKSRESFLGSALRVKIQAEPLENGQYRIARDEWDRTFGPVMERATANIIRDNRKPVDEDTLMCVSHGYGAMDSEQTRGFHSLMQAFSTAANKDYANHMGGDYKQKMLDFAAAHDGGHVTVDRTQLEGLTAIARAATSFARNDKEFPKVDAFWKSHVEENPSMTYRRGILGRFL